MTSQIDATKPVYGNPTTESVRDNFAIAANEISALQDGQIAEAPLDGQLYGRQSRNWLAVPPAGIPDAPTSGQLYGRQTGTWQPLPPTFADAPADGQLYGRQSQAWSLVPPAGIADAPNDGNPYQRFNHAWAPASILTPAMFAAPIGGADATTQLQAGLDAAYNLGLDFVIAGGVYGTTGLKVYAGQTVRGAPGAQLKMLATGPVIRTLNAPGLGLTASVKGVVIDKIAVDMNAQAGCAFLLEGAWFCSLRQPQIVNLAAPGTWPWTDAYGTGALPNAGIIVKGVAAGGAGGGGNTGVTAHYNKIEIVDIEKSQTGGGGHGLWFGTSPGGSDHLPNYNQVFGGSISTCASAVYVSAGDDNTFEALDTSANTTGYSIGLDGTRVYRTRIVKPYCESCQTGVHIGIYSDRAILEGTGSFAGTVVPVLEDAGSLYHATQYLNFDTNTGANQLVQFDQQAGGMWNICSGAGGVANSALAHVSYGTPGFSLIRYNGTPQAKTGILSGQTLGTLSLFGHDGTSLGSGNAGPSLTWFADENWSPTARGSHLTINIIAPGTLTRQGEVIVRSTGTFLLHGVGFYGATPPPARPGATGNAATVAAGSTTAAYTNTSYSGGSGSTGYTVGDLVAILKSYGMIQN
jgi:hypothetical protein